MLRTRARQLFPRKTCRPKSNIANAVTSHRGEVFVPHLPYRDLRGSRSNIWRVSCAFIEHRRLHSVMENVTHTLSPAMQRGIAEHFRDLNPKPIGGAPKELVAGGKHIYEEGVSDANIPPCASCHGPEAKGNGVFPRLAGQLDEYIQNKLLGWSQERGQDPANPDTSAIMQPIAHTLTRAQIAAVAAYLNYLE